MRIEALLIRRQTFLRFLDFLICLLCFIQAVMLWEFRGMYREDWMVWLRSYAFILLGAALTGALFTVRKLDAQIFSEMMRHR